MQVRTLEGKHLPRVAKLPAAARSLVAVTPVIRTPSRSEVSERLEQQHDLVVQDAQAQHVRSMVRKCCDRHRQCPKCTRLQHRIMALHSIIKNMKCRFDAVAKDLCDASFRSGFAIAKFQREQVSLVESI